LCGSRRAETAILLAGLIGFLTGLQDCADQQDLESKALYPVDPRNPVILSSLLETLISLG
jgi:hypothetical protein